MKFGVENPLSGETKKRKLRRKKKTTLITKKKKKKKNYKKKKNDISSIGEGDGCTAGHWAGRVGAVPGA
jgi:hypothetical protein